LIYEPPFSSYSTMVSNASISAMCSTRHHGNIVKQWLGERQHQIELFYISPYAPQLNPDEYLNHALKRNVYLGISPRTMAGIKDKVGKFMQRLSSSRQEVMAFFGHKNVRYISDI